MNPGPAPDRIPATTKPVATDALPMPAPAQVDQAIRLSYAQVMLNAIFGASTGGMFLIGYALALGGNNILLGLMSTVPAFFVVFQFLAAYFVERGVSRKKLTVVFAFLPPLCWFLIATIPLLGNALGVSARFTVLIGVIALVSLAGQFVGNARSSWIGELIPATRRGKFFGYCTMFAGLVGAFFAVGEGRFLDVIQSRGLFAFTALFFFGAFFGLISALLNIPQADCPLPAGGRQAGYLDLIRETFRNRPLVLLALVHATIALGAVAGPFTAAYCLRDVHLPYFGLGVLNAIATVAMLATSPFWGKLVDRFGCRPVLILGILLSAPCGLVWLFIPPGATHRAYLLLPWTNSIAGIGGAAINVAIATMTYKLSKPAGRSVQFALYSVFVTLVAAPMPLLGGWLVDTLTAGGYKVDLRLTFYLWVVFMFAAGILAKFLQEPDSLRTRALVFGYFPERAARFWGNVMAFSPWISSLIRFQLPAGRPADGETETPPKEEDPKT